MSAQDLDQKFSAALSAMKEKYKTTSEMAERIDAHYRTSVYGKTTLDSYYKERESVKASRKISFIAVSDALCPTNEMEPKPESLYGKINKLIFGPEKPGVPKELNGLYRYWRCFPDALTQEDLRWGIVKISTTSLGESTFEHWSTDAITPILKKNNSLAATPFDALKEMSDPEDVGYAFYASEILMTLGFREGNIRLAIAQAQPKNLKSVALNGMILSKRNPGNSIFSSCFLMFHETHPDVNEVLSGEEFRSRTKFYVGQKNKLMVCS